MPSRDEILKEYAAAVAQESDARDHAFCDWFPWQVRLGKDVFELRPMRISDFAVLAALANPCLDDPDACTPQEVLTFCHVLRFNRALTPEQTAKAMAHFPFDALKSALRNYVELTFADSPATAEGIRRKAYTSYLASIVHCLAKAYGWTRSEIMDTPLAAFYQLLKIQQQEADPKTPLFNRSDSILNKLVASSEN